MLFGGEVPIRCGVGLWDGAMTNTRPFAIVLARLPSPYYCKEEDCRGGSPVQSDRRLAFVNLRIFLHPIFAA